MSAFLYTHCMAITNPQWSPEELQTARAQYLRKVLKDERWTLRPLAVRTGLAKSTIESRLNGQTDFLFPEIQIFAEVLHRNPVELYSTMLAVLPDLDSNQEPAGFKSAPQYKVTNLNTRRNTSNVHTYNAPATVTPLTLTAQA